MSTSDAAPSTSAPLSPAEVRRALNISTIEGAVATITITITGAIGGSAFLTGFALLLGANEFQLGLLGALPFIGQIFQFVGAYLEGRGISRRSLVLYGSLFGRLIWGFLLALPFVAFLERSHMLIFLFGLGISYALNGIGGNAWLSWMSDLVPPNQRGRYFGVRNMVVSISTMVSNFGAGLLLDYFRNQGREDIGYAVIFGVAVISALGAAALVRIQPEPPMQARPQRPSLRDMFGAPLRDPRFRSYIMISTGWMLVTGLAAPFFSAYGLSTLKLSFATLSLTAIVTSAVALVFQPSIGRLQDSLGDRRVMIFSALGTVVLPFGWILSTPDNIIPLWLTSIFSGVFWPGINQGIMNVLMDRAPSAARGSAIASYSAITGIGTLVAGLIGGAIASAVGPEALIALGPMTLTNLSLLFVATSIGRAIMVLIFWRAL